MTQTNKDVLTDKMSALEIRDVRAFRDRVALLRWNSSEGFSSAMQAELDQLAGIFAGFTPIQREHFRRMYYPSGTMPLAGFIGLIRALDGVVGDVETPGQD